MPPAIATALAENRSESRNVSPVHRRNWREVLALRWETAAWMGTLAAIFLAVFGTVRFQGRNEKNVFSQVGSQMQDSGSSRGRLAARESPAPTRAAKPEVGGGVGGGVDHDKLKAFAKLQQAPPAQFGGSQQNQPSVEHGLIANGPMIIRTAQLARLANARNTEQRLTDLLRNRTGKLSDVLEVEQEVDRVRGEIEQMEAERKNMANQVSFATLNATITEDYQAQLQVVPPSTSTRLGNAAVEGYRSMVDGVLSLALFLLSNGPSLLLWGAVLFMPARLVWKRVRRSLAA